MLNDTQNAWKSRHETPADTRRGQNGRQHLAATGAACALKNPSPHCGVVDVSRLAAAG